MADLSSRSRKAFASCPRIEGLESRRLLSMAGYNGPGSGLSGLTQTALSDGMGDLSAWTTVSGNSPTLVTLDPSAPNTPYMSLANGLARAELNQTFSQDFSLSFKVLQSSYSRGQWVGLFNSAGTQGYAAMWDSALSNQYGGQGAVTIRKFSLASELTDWTQDGTALNTGVASGHAALSYPFAVFKLNWDNYTHTLSLNVDGVQKASVTDSSFTSFSRIYIKGNTSGLFDDVTVSAGGKLQSGTLIDDRFTDFATATDPTARPDQPWTLLSGSASIANNDAGSGERRLLLSSSGTRLATPIASVLDTLANAPVINIAYDLRRSTTAGNAGAIFLVDATGHGYGFATELAADNYSYAALHVYNTSDFGASYTEVGAPQVFAGVIGTGNHVIDFSWNRSSASAFGIGAYSITGTIDGRSALTIVNGAASAYSGFAQGVAWSYGAQLYMDNVLVSAVPYNAVNLRSYATGNGTTDDQNAITNAIKAAGQGSKILYAPPGTYAHSNTLTLNGIALIGAGNTSVFRATNYAKSAIFLTGTSPALRRVRTTVTTTSRGWDLPHNAVTMQNATNYIVSDIQVENSYCVGIYATGSSYGNTVNNTVLNTMADGIHHTGGTHDVQVFNNNIRNAGDDEIAVVSYLSDGVISSRISAFHNMTSGQTHGRGVSVVGGINVVYDHNEIANAYGAGVYVAGETGTYNTYGVDSITVRRNIVDSPRGIAADGSLSYAGVQVTAASASYPLSNVVVEANTITNAAFRGAGIGNYVSNLAFTYNLIDTTGDNGLQSDGAGGTVNIIGNTIRNTRYYGMFIGSGNSGSWNVNSNHLININSSNLTYIDGINIGSTSLFLTITNNDYTESGADYLLERFIECWTPASNVNRSNNLVIAPATTIDPNQNYWAA